MPKVSVIIPTYNRAIYVTKAIDSVLAQSYRDYEIIVVDDGSTDNTKDALEPYMNRIKYIYQQNTGVSAARNTGIEASQGKWIAFLDSDDEWLPEKLSIQMKDISENPELCAHITNIIFNSDEMDSVTLFEVRKFKTPDASSFVIEKPFPLILKSGIAVTSSFVVERETLFKAGLFDTRLSIGEDKDLFLRVSLQGSWGCSSVPLVNYYRREGSERSLSQQFHGNPKHICETGIYLLTKISEDFQLNENEKASLSKALSDKLFLQGWFLRKDGNNEEARSCFKRSLKLNNSFKTVIKYYITLLPFSFGFWLLRCRFLRKSKKFHV